LTWWDSTLNWLSKNIPWQIMSGLFVATGVLLFFSARLGIYEWAHPYRGLEITVFAFSGTVLLAKRRFKLCAVDCKSHTRWESAASR
jgi:hypothetical protein